MKKSVNENIIRLRSLMGIISENPDETNTIKPQPTTLSTKVSFKEYKILIIEVCVRMVTDLYLFR